jgi:8-oxo-dGTP pyrophosphatase MutT (NUDIX family)
MDVDTDAVFSAEWRLADDGVYERSSARAVIVDDSHRVLLMRATEGESSWWFTVGGGIADGEDERVAAVREAGEETGLRIDPAELVGPILRRVPTFTFLGRTCRQDEVLYLARVDGNVPISSDGWTDLELASMDGTRWWPLDELRSTDETVYPPDLGERVASVLEHGWDGSTPMTE